MVKVGQSWAPFGGPLSLSGVSLGALSGRIGGASRESPSGILEAPWGLVSHLNASRGTLGALWGRLGVGSWGSLGQPRSPLKPSGAMLSRHANSRRVSAAWAVWGLSRSVLEPRLESLRRPVQQRRAATSGDGRPRGETSGNPSSDYERQRPATGGHVAKPRGSPKRPPRGPPERGSKMPPRGPQEVPGDSQEAPKRPPRCSQGAPKTVPQRPPRALRRDPQQNP